MLAQNYYNLVTKLVCAATHIERVGYMKHFICILIVVIGTALGFAIGNSSSVQSCQCDEDCKCCASCSCSHGEN